MEYFLSHRNDISQLIYYRLGTKIFEMVYGNDTFFTAEFTLDLISIVDPLSQLAAIFIVPLFTRRALMIFGCIGIGAINISIGFFDTANNNVVILILVLLLIVFTSIF